MKWSGLLLSAGPHLCRIIAVTEGLTSALKVKVWKRDGTICSAASLFHKCNSFTLKRGPEDKLSGCRIYACSLVEVTMFYADLLM